MTTLKQKKKTEK